MSGHACCHSHGSQFPSQALAWGEELKGRGLGGEAARADALDIQSVASQIEYKSHRALVEALLSLEETNPRGLVPLSLIDYVVAAVLSVAPPLFVFHLRRVPLRKVSVFRLHRLAVL